MTSTQSPRSGNGKTDTWTGNGSRARDTWTRR